MSPSGEHRVLAEALARFIPEGARLFAPVPYLAPALTSWELVAEAEPAAGVIFYARREEDVDAARVAELSHALPGGGRFVCVLGEARAGLLGAGATLIGRLRGRRPIAIELACEAILLAGGRDVAVERLDRGLTLVHARFDPIQHGAGSAGVPHPDPPPRPPRAGEGELGSSTTDRESDPGFGDMPPLPHAGEGQRGAGSAGGPHPDPPPRAGEGELGPSS